MVKKGDTLIEVTLAIGIFSMIAISIVAVMSSGTSGAQTALETTLTRQEIDTQAEALRFIQASYDVNKTSTDKRFANLWSDITSHAIVIKDWDNARREAVLQYAPSSCSDIFGDDHGDISDNAFIINPRKLGTFKADDISEVYVFRDKDANKFTTASTYPRVVYGRDDSQADSDSNSLIGSGDKTDLYRAEGIYVLAVSDCDTTALAGDDKFCGNSQKVPAFYDFYIRTCWYGSDATEPSTISTVIRLHNPDATATSE